jgi:hypothetical protein
LTYQKRKVKMLTRTPFTIAPVTRRKVVYPTGEIAHMFAHSTQPEARNVQGNFSFVGAKLLSYTTVIARRLGADLYLVSSNSYSRTTAGHQSDARQATCHDRTLHLPMDRYGNVLASAAQGEVTELYTKAASARTKAVDYTAQAERICKDMFDYDGTVLVVPSPAEIAAIKQREKASNALQRERAAELEKIREEANALRKLAALERLEDWRKGAAAISLRDLPAALRLSADGERIETSHSASVPVRHAKRIWQAVQANALPESLQIGQYSTARKALTATHLRIGCHEIALTELDAIALQLNFGARNV